MATSSSRDVKLTLSLETLGEADVAKLQTALQNLAKEGGDAAPAFERLAQEVSQLGAQSAAINTFKELSAALEALRAKQESTATAASDVAARLEEQRKATADLQAVAKGTTEALTAGQVAYVQATNAIRSLKVETDNAGKQTAAYRGELAAAVATQNAAREALVGLRADQRAATQEANAAEATQAKLETTYGRVSAAATRAATALQEGESALRDQAAAASVLGVQTEDIALAEAELTSAYNRGVTAIQAHRAAQQEAAAASAEQAESDRLALIQQQAWQAAIREGDAALVAENATIREAAASMAAYEAATLAAAEAEVRWQQEADAIVAAAEAQRVLIATTEQAILAERELAAQTAFEKQAQDAKQLLQAAEYVQFWEQALTQAEATASRVDAALKTVGVGSVTQLNAEIQAVRDSLKVLETEAGLTGAELQGAFSAGNAKIEALQAQIRELTGTMTLADHASGLFKETLGQIAAGNLIAQGVAFLIQKVKDLASEFVGSIASLQRFNNALNAIYKDSNTTAQQLEFLRKTALESGVAVGDLQGSFVKFSASMRGANIPLQTSNDLFEALTRAGGTLGLTSEEVAGSLEALSQMASKGVVSMEELRQQLGDRLPGAFGLVAKGFGITEAQLTKLVESGSLAARDLFPALTASLKTMAGEVTGITPAFENLKTVLTETAQSAGEGGWADVLTAGIKALTVAVGLVVLPLAAFSEVVFGVAKAAGVLAGALVTLTNPTKALGEIVDDAATRQNKLTQAFDDSINGSQRQSEAMQIAAGAVQNLTTAQAGLQTVTVSTVDGQKALELATTLAGNASLSASQRWVQLGVALAQSLAAQTKQIEASDKSAKAVNAEGQALVGLSNLRGDEQVKLTASAQAAETYLAALQKAATAHQTETDLLNVQRAALIESAQARGLTAQQLQTETQALDGKIAKSQAETDQSKAAVAQQQLEVAARETAVRTYQDNSNAVDSLRAAMSAANTTLARLTELEAAGAATKQQVTDATIAAAQAQALYNDALADSVAKIEAQGRVQSAQASLELAQLDVKRQAIAVEQSYYEQLAQTARGQGNVAAANEYTRLSILAQIDALDVNIQITKLKAQADAAAANATIAAQEALLQELAAEGKLTPVKKLEIEATELEAKAKLAAAGASQSLIQALDNEKQALFAKLDAVGQESNAVGSSTGVTNSDTAARYANAKAIDAQTAALGRKSGALTDDGFATNSSGAAAGTFNNGLPLDAIFDLIAKRNAGTLSTDDLALAQTALAQATANVQSIFDMVRGNAASVSNGVQTEAGAQLEAVREILDQLQSSGGAARTGTIGGGNSKLPAPTPAPAPTPTTAPTPAPTPQSTSHTVTINFGGSSTTINTASDADSAALVNLLKQLEQQAATAS